ncbi:hypothetical protein G9A89_007589 [Geosiphon pyriformis]|nr:hypothetical protein G9A89_007589 [Geosiphon pyriformis]
MTDSITTTFKVLSLNCWGLKFVSKKRTERMKCIADILADSDYEIIGLQEVWVYSDYELIREKTRQRFSFSRFFQRLNGRPIKFTHGDWYVGKGVGSILIEHPVAGYTEIFISHTHAGYGSKNDDIYLGHRVSQAWEIANILRNSAARGRNVIALGDFNNDSDSLLYKLITQHGQMTDAWAFQNSPSSDPNQQQIAFINFKERNTEIGDKGITSNSPANTWSRNYSIRDLNQNQNLGQRIDYIFFRKTSQFWCVRSRVVFTDIIPEYRCSYSDHFGVDATFILAATDKNSSSALEEPGFESFSNLDPVIYRPLIDLLRKDLEVSASTAQFQLITFWLSLIFVIGGIIAEALITAKALEPHPWIHIFILIGVTTFVITGVIFGLIGFLFGNSEQRGLKHLMDEVESFVEGKIVNFDKRTKEFNQDSKNDKTI